MSERKYAITEMKNAFDLFISNENIWWQNQWAWTQIDRNLPEWNAKRKKTEGKHRTEYPRTVGSFQKMFPMLGLRIPEGEARTGRKKYLKLILVYVVVQLLSCVWLFVTPWTAVHQVSLSITISWSLLKLMSIEWWCLATISSSVVPSPPASNLSQHQGLFKCQLFTSGGQSTGVSASASVLPMNIQDWFPLGWAGCISLLSKRLSTVFSNNTVQKYQFFGTQLSL